MNVIKKMYLTTQDGRTLALDASEKVPENGEGLHLYCVSLPVAPLVASTLGPRDFFDLIVKNPTSLN